MPTSKPSPAGFQRREVRGRVYQIFVPQGAAPVRGWPCVLFLHGVGQNGTDGERHLEVGLPRHVRRHAETFPAVVVMPQCGGRWKYVGFEEEVALGALDATARELSIDPDRVYLTGLSQGGCSTFDLGAKFPDRWAALVVVCGAGKPEDAPRMPIWIFHGEKDDRVPPSGHHGFDDESVGGRDMAKRLPHAKYTEFPGAGHDIWDRVYGDPALWDWLFAQRRP
jgi:predicted peptidase